MHVVLAIGAFDQSESGRLAITTATQILMSQTQPEQRYFYFLENLNTGCPLVDRLLFGGTLRMPVFFSPEQCALIGYGLLLLPGKFSEIRKRLRTFVCFIAAGGTRCPSIDTGNFAYICPQHSVEKRVSVLRSTP